MTGALLGAVVLLAINARIVRMIHRFDWAVRVFEGGEGALVVKDGSVVDRALRREGLRRADVESVLRAQGADGPGDVAEATLIRADSIVVRLKPEEMTANHADIAAVLAPLDQLKARVCT